MRYSITHKKLEETGAYSLQKVCDCDSLEAANFLLDLLKEKFPDQKYWVEQLGKKETLLLCIDPAQVEMGWACQQWIQSRGAQAVTCFSMSDFEYIRDTYTTYGIPYMVALVAESLETWKELNYDLKMSSFEEEDFEVILSLME